MSSLQISALFSSGFVCYQIPNIRSSPESNFSLRTKLPLKDPGIGHKNRVLQGLSGMSSSQPLVQLPATPAVTSASSYTAHRLRVPIVDLSISIPLNSTVSTLESRYLGQDFNH